MLSVVTDEQRRAELACDLDELVREGARRMLAAALEAEVDTYLAAHHELTDERGHRLVRRNGHAQPRQVTTAAGQVEVVRPRVDDRRVDPQTGERVQFQSVILPRWCRRSPKVTELLPCCTCTGCPAWTSCPRWSGSSELRPAYRPRW
jgi:putative transposase